MTKAKQKLPRTRKELEALMQVERGAGFSAGVSQRGEFAMQDKAELKRKHMEQLRIMEERMDRVKSNAIQALVQLANANEAIAKAIADILQPGRI